MCLPDNVEAPSLKKTGRPKNQNHHQSDFRTDTVCQSQMHPYRRNNIDITPLLSRSEFVTLLPDVVMNHFQLSSGKFYPEKYGLMFPDFISKDLDRLQTKPERDTGNR